MAFISAGPRAITNAFHSTSGGAYLHSPAGPATVAGPGSALRRLRFRQRGAIDRADLPGGERRRPQYGHRTVNRRDGSERLERGRAESRIDQDFQRSRSQRSCGRLAAREFGKVPRLGFGILLKSAAAQPPECALQYGVLVIR
jgi:hypothetical protein